MTPRPQRHIATTLAAAFLLLGAPATIAVAATEPGAETAPTTSATADLIDPTAPVSLTIQKYEGDPVPANPDGTPSDTTALTPLPGVTFTVQRLDLDLTDPAAWETLSGTTAAAVADGSAGIALADAGTAVTGADGVATFDTATNPAFIPGAYLVTEQQFGGYTVAPPFLVTLPYSDATTGTWAYDRTVYPKNQDVTPDKQVDDTGATIGTPLAYTVNAPVPAGELTQFVVTDPLSTDLALDPASVTVQASTDGVTVGDLALDPATDYTVDTANNTVTVTFTDAGRAALQAARLTNPGLTVHVGFDATVVGISSPDGRITNTATVTIPGGQVTTDTLTGPTATTFAPLTITKTGPADATNDELNGAQFELYQCAGPDTGGTWSLLGDALPVATDPTGAPATVLTTDGGVAGGAASTADGYGVPASSFSGGATGTVTNTYCVLETAAPDGFLRNPQPQPVAYDSTANTLTVSVVDQRDTLLGQLPATGAWGVGLVLLAGGALIARGVHTSRREERAEQV